MANFKKIHSNGPFCVIKRFNRYEVWVSDTDLSDNTPITTFIASYPGLAHATIRCNEEAAKGINWRPSPVK